MVYDLQTLKELNKKAEEKMYVVIYVGDFYSGEYIKYFRLFNKNGSPILTDSLDSVKILSLEDALSIVGKMSVKDDWEIWSVKRGLVLNKQWSPIL